MIIIDALKSSNARTPANLGTSPASARPGVAGHPFFIPGKTWSSLPFLPTPEQLRLPPAYLADLLLQVYFDRLHASFPLLHKDHFLRKYKSLQSGRQQQRTEARFLAVLYAVCACASSLLLKDHFPSSPFPGLEYYENANLMQLRCMGEACIEQIQCLALLAHCAAGWNTLSQAWKYAGQAVRAAQDLGYHVRTPYLHPCLPRSSRVS